MFSAKKVLISTITLLIAIGFVLPLASRNLIVSGATNYVSDTFSRTSASGWGSSEAGGTYATSNTTDYSVNGTQGVISTNANTTRVAYNNTVSVQDTEHVFRVKTSAVPAGGNQQINIVARNVGSNTYYRGKFVFNTAGQMTINFSRLVSGSETDLSSATTVPGITLAPNTFYWVRMQVSGTSPTTLRARVWQDGQSEPGNWIKTVTNAQAELQTSGSVGLQTFVSSASTVSPVLFTFDDYVVSSIDTVSYASMADTFTRTTSNGWGTADSGGLYTYSGGSITDYSVNGNAAVVAVPTGNTHHRMFFGSFSSLNTDTQIQLKTDKVAAGSTMYHYLLGRRNDSANSEYVAQVILNTNQSVGVRLLKLVNGTETNLTAVYIVPELRHVANEGLNVRLVVEGSTPATIKAKLWGADWKEPDWQLTATDSQAELQQSGSVGVRSYVSSSASNLPLSFAYDSFSADGELPADPTTADGSSEMKGVNWHLGPWYNTSNAPNAYYYQGMYSDLDIMQAAGIEWARISLNRATQTTCTPTSFYSKIRDALQARGMKALIYVSIPDASTTTATTQQLSDFNAWLATMVNCYKDDFKHWEIGNEPNLSAFWNIDSSSGSDPVAYEQSVQWYYDYLQTAYSTIKGIDPTATVIHAGLSQFEIERWMSVAASINPSAYMDAMAFHPYSDVGATGSVNYLNRLYAAMQDIPGMGSKPIWITELGFTADPAEYPGNAGGSESTKATALSESYQDLLDWGITTPIFWYDFNQDATLGSTGYELVNVDYNAVNYTQLPAYSALAALWPSPVVSPTASPQSSPSSQASPNTSSAGSSSTSSRQTGEYQPAGCSHSKPVGRPDLYQIDRSDSLARLYFAPVGGTVTNYVISYGEGTQTEQHATIISARGQSGAWHTDIGSLAAHSGYSFKVRALNDCQPGEWSNALTTYPSLGKGKATFYAHQPVASITSQSSPLPKAIAQDSTASKPSSPADEQLGTSGKSVAQTTPSASAAGITQRPEPMTPSPRPILSSQPTPDASPATTLVSQHVPEENDGGGIWNWLLSFFR